MNFDYIYKELESKNAEAWILVDYENRNPAIVHFLGNMMLTRKMFVVFENGGQYIICHSIDNVFLSKKEIADQFTLYTYNTWEEMLELEREHFKYKKVLMDISDKGLLPRVSLADYGSVYFIKSLGIEVHSSGDILQIINACYDEESYQLQLKACETTLKIKDEAFKLIGELVECSGKTDEYTIQRFIADRFHEEGMVFDDPAIVAVNSNASNPHYAPTEKVFTEIKKGDVVLIDMWAKYDHPKAVYADITWMGYVGEEVPENVESRFQILKNAIDKAESFLKETIPTRPVSGFEVDRIVRDSVSASGYGKYFTHRTGHNISVDVSPHGPGANIDDYESHDTRFLIEGTSFSLEPGIYAPDFGCRSETNVAIHDGQAVVVAGRQQHVIAILKK